MNLLDQLAAAVAALLTDKSGLLEPTGYAMFVAFATLSIVFHGLAVMHGAPGAEYRLGKLLLLNIPLCFTMLKFYTAPIPFLGLSFSRLVGNSGLAIANQIGTAGWQEMMTRLGTLQSTLQTPGMSPFVSIPEIVRWGVMFLLPALAEGAAFCVISAGYIFAAICLLFGPVCIPFFLVPPMQWIFRGWMRKLITYSFYPAAATALAFVFSRLLANTLYRSTADGLDAVLLALYFPYILVLLLAFVYCCWKIPSFVDGFFAGH